MKRKWWLLGTAAVAALLCLCLFGARLRLAPRWILSRALGTALAELDTRFENSPARLMAAALDKEGRQKAGVQLETQTENMGVVRYDMSLQTQLNPCRVKAGGTVVTGGKILDLELYLDQDFAAVSSGELLGGNFYGINYDTFSRDIRSRELLALLIGEKTIRQWEDSVSNIQKNMSRNITLPEISIGDIPGMLYGMLALEPQIGQAEILISGQQEKTQTVSFRATGQEIASMAETYLDQMDPVLRNLIQTLKATPDTAVCSVFYLYQDKLVRIDMELELSGKSAVIQADLGLSPAVNPLTLELEVQDGEVLTRFTMNLDTKSDTKQYAETLSFSQTRNGVRNSGNLDYNWDLSSGELKLAVQLKEREADIRMNLEGEGDSLMIRTQDAAPLLNLFLKKQVNHPIICTLNLSPGGVVTVPEYRNLDQWSMEDLRALLSGLGGLLGLPIP